MAINKTNKRNCFRIIRIVVMILVLTVPVLAISQNKKKNRKIGIQNP
jgi:hypothetical protein